MPNTLCHIGIQSPLSGHFIETRELPWVLAGCIIPDLPWIGLKLLLVFELFNPYDLRLFFTAQASLIFCLLLSAGLSTFVRYSRRIFAILAANCFLHLALDSLQIKWGNGVHFLAPFDWKMFGFDLFWPENMLLMILSLFGLIYLIAQWRPIITSTTEGPPIFECKSKVKVGAGVLLLTLYLACPFFCMESMEKSNTYFIQTMKDRSSRPGKGIALDRARYSADKGEIRLYSGEKLTIVGSRPQESGRVSFRGTFLSPDTVLSTNYHYHRDFRDLASLLGLFLTCTLMLQSLILSRIKK